MKPTLISVIIPNYNHEPYLEQRMESILHQTYQHIEIIILDDASTDGSKRIIENYRSNKLITHIIINESNSGSTFLQWDRGLNKAQGEFIWIAESDDYCEPYFLEDLVSKLQNNTVLAYAQSFFINSNDQILYQSSAEYPSQHLKGEVFIKQYMLNKNAIYNTSMCIWRKSCYPFISKEFLKYKYCGDWIFWNELAIRGNVLISCKLHNYYRKHKQTVSNEAIQTGVAIKEELLAIGYLAQQIPVFKENLQQIILVKIEQYYANQLFMNTYKYIIHLYPFMKHPSIKRKVFYLKTKVWAKKVLMLLSGGKKVK